MAAEEHFGPYRVEELLGHGAMGEVHRAVDTRRNRVVALKRLSPTLRTDRTFLARFEREASAAARLRHRHVVPINDFGVIDGRPYIDMRLIEGTDLRTVLRRSGPLGVRRAVAVIGQVAGALDAAHAAGLVHRDVKASNVLLDAHGSAYLIDFGLARDDGGTRLTQSGVAVGTLAYMAPERFDGEGDHRVDVYALSCLLFEVLTGRLPFPVVGLTAMMHAHLTTPPPRVSSARRGLPPAMDEVVATGLHKDPAQRYARAGDLAAAAEAALLGAAPPPPRGRRRAGRVAVGRRAAYAALAVAGAAAVALGVAVTAETVTPGRAEADPAAAPAPAAAVVAEVEVGGAPRGLVAGAGGRAYATDRDGDTVTVVGTGTGAVERLVPLAPGSGPDGIAVVPGGGTAFVVGNGSGEVAVVALATGRVRSSHPVPPSPTDVALGPDGSTAYVIAGEQGQVLALDQEGVIQVMATGGRPRSVAVAPDGRTLLVTDADRDALLVVDAATGLVDRTVPVGPQPDGVALSPDGRTALVVDVEEDSLSVVDLGAGVVRTVVEVGRGLTAVAVHPDGRSAFVTANLSDTLTVVDVATASVLGVVPVGRAPGAVAVAPDGSRVYVANTGDGTLSVIDPGLA
jgi:serine/threonine-protein kinase